ncbi:MAG: SGNH/GDSL hydrolase family protein [Oceanospirillaceae bacterium]|nr:SGNH/GDSL hydrolase family protein [Oceanospirillaceae bacterium]MCP5335611.1 SGNH/GDSL hydrolase family protein [Oceanospirillaceae bacterium]
MQHFNKLLFTALLGALLTGCGGGSTVADADNDQVITVGDSIFDLSNEIQINLESFAGQTFRKYTKSGAELSGGSVAQSVVDQYAEAKADNSAITTVVMDGGGNDILIPVISLADPYGCKTNIFRSDISSNCKALIDDVYVEAVNLLNSMDNDGVQNVVYLGYYHTKNAFYNNLGALAKAVDYGDLRLAQACNNSTVNCTFLDPRSLIVNSDINADGIHPNSSGSLKLANLIWPTLQPLL